MVKQLGIGVLAVTLTALMGCQPSIRKDVKDLTAEEKAVFVEAVLALKEMPSPYDPTLSYYDQFVQWHLEIDDCLEFAYHGGPAFLPWHRIYLLEFERALSEAAGRKVSIPYWNWTDPDSTAAVFSDDFMGGSGDPGEGYAVTTGPFRTGEWEVSVFMMGDDFQFPYLTRNLGSEFSPDLPTAAQVEEALSIPVYDVSPWNQLSDPFLSFRNYLEGWRGVEMVGCTSMGMTQLETAGSSEMHNRVHVWTGGAWETEDGDTAFGTMALMSSPADPVFWLHHAYVDYIWEQWMARHGKLYEPKYNGRENHHLTDVMWPFTKEVSGRDWRVYELLDSALLGVFYKPSRPAVAE